MIKRRLSLIRGEQEERLEGNGGFWCSPWGIRKEVGRTGALNYPCFSYSRQVPLNRQIHLLSIWQRQLKDFGNPSFNTGIWSRDKFHHWLDSPISAYILHQPRLVVWKQNKAWCAVIVSIGQAEGRKNSSGPWWKGDGKGEEYCCFFPPIKLFVKPFTKGYAVYLFKINTLVSVWKLVPTQDRPINYSVLCAIAELLKVEPYLFLFQINNYLLPCSCCLLEIDVLFIQCL